MHQNVCRVLALLLPEFLNTYFKIYMKQKRGKSYLFMDDFFKQSN